MFFEMFHAVISTAIQNASELKMTSIQNGQTVKQEIVVVCNQKLKDSFSAAGGPSSPKEVSSIQREGIEYEIKIFHVCKHFND